MIKAKKSLGQNFLIDKNIIKKIVNTTNVKDKVILEIGPGTGNLTSEILIKSPKNCFTMCMPYKYAHHPSLFWVED